MKASQTRLKFLLTLNENKELVLMDKSDSSQKYGEVQREFAKRIAREEDWTSVSMLRLYDDQIIDGINYLEDYSENGVYFTLICPENTDDSVLEGVKKRLRDARDALGFKSVTYPQGLDFKTTETDIIKNIFKKVDEMSDDEIKAGMDEIITKDVDKSLEFK